VSVWRDIIAVTVQHLSHDRVFQDNVVESVTSRVELELVGTVSKEEIISVISRALDDHTIYFGDDGPSPWMHMAVMGENTA
jgi:hypothetical protein